MENMEIYDMVREVPVEAKTTIIAGRLKGMTDINPMWRIKTLTETFGPVGFGWWYKINDMHIEKSDGIEQIAVVNITMWVKYGDEVSQGFDGTGGSKFVASEKAGPYVSDECYKMALTDAISVCAKAIGVGADVYYAKDRTKYSPSCKPANEDPADELKKIIAEKGEDKCFEWLSKHFNMEIKNVSDLSREQILYVLRRFRNG